MAEFEPAFKFMVPHEGGYVNDPDDPGGETKFGISRRSYPSVDIANLTLDDAHEIYWHDFWVKHPYWKIDDQDLANKVFDFAVNMGHRRSQRLLQRALSAVKLGVTEDGYAGPITITRVNDAPPKELLAALKSEAAGHYRLLASRRSSLKKFLNGWMNRAYA